VRRILAACATVGIPTAGGSGRGPPTVTQVLVRFNGVEHCGHEQRALGITWPAKGARGISVSHTRGTTARAQPTALHQQFLDLGFAPGNISTEGSEGRSATHDSDVAGSWFAGAQLRARTCGGDCSHESVVIPRVVRNGAPIGRIAYDDAAGKPVENPPEEVGKYFECCKTAYKPYDVAVTAVLVSAKQHFGSAFRITSDGDLEHWQDGMALCQELLGYGEAFVLDD
jgi:hypothetical protein